MVRIRKAHPAEERRAGIERAQPRDRAIRDPVRVVVRPRDVVVRDFRRAGVAAGSAREDRAEAGHFVRMMLVEPRRVVMPSEGSVRGEFGMIESPPGGVVPLGGAAVLGKTQQQIEMGIEMRLAEQRGAVAGGTQHACDVRRGIVELDAVRDDAVRERMLPGEHRRARRHADDVLDMRAPVEHAVAGESVDDRCARERMAGDAERIVSLLIDGDEENVATARARRSRCRGRRRPGVWRPRAPGEERAAREPSNRVRDGGEVHVGMLPQRIRRTAGCSG